MNIILDIGHASCTGARGHARDEHEVNTRLANILRRKLRGAGHGVNIVDYPTRSNTQDLRMTIDEANRISLPDSIGLSLHSDCSDNPQAHGAHVIYTSTAGAELAACIAAPLCTLLPGRADQTRKRSNLAILKGTIAPWVIVESGFISHAVDSAYYTSEGLDAIASAIAEGIKSYAANL